MRIPLLFPLSSFPSLPSPPSSNEQKIGLDLLEKLETFNQVSSR